jgi:hypothetical protein
MECACWRLVCDASAVVAAPWRPGFEDKREDDPGEGMSGKVTVTVRAGRANVRSQE